MSNRLPTLTPNQAPAGTAPAAALRLSASALVFPKTTPGRPRFLVLTIAQPDSAEPVVLTTDEPALFQLASDAQPLFGPRLTLHPAPGGTHVHVRYTPTRPGQHDATLRVEAATGPELVALRGRAVGLLPSLPGNPPADGFLVSGRWRGVLASVLLGGLVTLGYAYRCELVPGWCTEAVRVEGFTPNLTPAVALPKATEADAAGQVSHPEKPVLRSSSTRFAPKAVARKPIRSGTRFKKKRVPPAVTPVPARREEAPSLIDPGTVVPGTVVRPSSAPVVTRRNRRRGSSNPVPTVPRTQPNSASQESELERVLNQKPPLR